MTEAAVPAPGRVRLVAVLGYSDGQADNLHAICAARLRRAEREARPEDVVLLSGWARGRDVSSEAELMSRTWNGRASRVVLDRGARSTFGNAAGVAAAARRLGAGEVVVVTSRWHARRARSLVRAALRDDSSTVSVSVTSDPPPRGARFREAACWLAVPFQRALTGRRALWPR
jgi:uncharacterized SAM-binding protein YcdF (DUF218 family)